MPMDLTGEPSKWVCRLVCHFPGSPSPIFGTGFLVNIPFTQKYCILTAGHNIARPEEGRANRVEVTFPNDLAFEASASAGELFVSDVYAANPTLSDSDPSSISDYGLVAVDRFKQPPAQGRALGGCSLSVLPSRSELLHTGGTVYGYSQGNVLQTKETSPFSRPVQARYLKYNKDTKPGVSGGPIFVSYNGSDVAVGIHNYNGRATRITLSFMLEVLSWISDYGLDRTFEDLTRRGVYLHATSGSTPKLVGRPGKIIPNAVFRLVPAYVAKENCVEHDHGFVILSFHTVPQEPGTFFFLTFEKVDDNDEHKGYRLSLREDVAPQRQSMISLWSRKKFKMVALMSDSNALISIRPRKRVRCECGCITQDDDVEVAALKPTPFFIARA
ncbi:hypothetical protein CEP53_000457 [Fusarium sp. AF-6]|nr:hypothetical protein CEP53_000457 [Fusarium sp. AF-6]